MRITLAQISPSVGDLRGNLHLIKEKVNISLSRNPDVIVFPELCSVGYPPRDILYNREIWENHDEFIKQLFNYIKSLNQQITVIVGGLHKIDSIAGTFSKYNAAYIIDKTFGIRIVHKRLLPCYDVFDETRYFKSGIDEPYIPIKIATANGIESCDVVICEDIWNYDFNGTTKWMSPESYTHDVISNLKGTGPIISINASPFWHGKINKTRQLLCSICTGTDRDVVWVNQVGGYDDIIFGGYSMYVTNKRLKHNHSPYVFSSNYFSEDLKTYNTHSTNDVTCDSLKIISQITENKKEIAAEDFDIWSITQALRFSIHEYCRRTGFKKVVFGCSGGIDSALVGVLCAQALGPENVTAITMPSKFSSSGSVDDSIKLAENLNINILNWNIKDLHSNVRSLCIHLGKKDFENSLTDENIQPRLRAILLMTFSNEYNALLISTGNKSEASVGYSTIYGDTCGGYALLIDVYKTMIFDICKFINKYYPNLIPMSIINKPPSAELKTGQYDSDSLPSYDILDPMLMDIIDNELPISEVKANTKSPERVNQILKMIDRSEFKRKQSPFGPKVNQRSFGTGRRIPIAKNITFV